MDPVNIPAKFEVCSFTHSWDNKGYSKNLGSPWIRPRSLTYLDLVPPVLSRTLGDELSPSGTIVGSVFRITPVIHSSISKSSFSVSCHVLLGRPTLLLPSSGIHSKASLAGLVVGSRRMWPTNRLLLIVTVSCSAICSDRAITSSFVMWSRHEMPNMLLRQLLEVSKYHAFSRAHQQCV